MGSCGGVPPRSWAHCASSSSNHSDQVTVCPCTYPSTPSTLWSPVLAGSCGRTRCHHLIYHPGSPHISHCISHLYATRGTRAGCWSGMGDCYQLIPLKSVAWLPGISRNRLNCYAWGSSPMSHRHSLARPNRHLGEGEKIHWDKSMENAYILIELSQFEMKLRSTPRLLLIASAISHFLNTFPSVAESQPNARIRHMWRSASLIAENSRYGSKPLIRDKMS